MELDRRLSSVPVSPNGFARGKAVLTYRDYPLGEFAKR